MEPKIYERNPDTGQIRWRYLGDYGNEKPLNDCQELKNQVLYKNNENNNKEG
tara:strand:+ start:378 stop:533 length:156 start_codon:yes stop_codon:yes gene_type:complete